MPIGFVAPHQIECVRDAIGEGVGRYEDKGPEYRGAYAIAYAIACARRDALDGCANDSRLVQTVDVATNDNRDGVAPRFQRGIRRAKRLRGGASKELTARPTRAGKASEKAVAEAIIASQLVAVRV